MKDFKDFGIKILTKGLIGEKVSIAKLINVPMEVISFKLTPSKFEGKSTCLNMQVKHSNENRVVFISAKYLIEQLKEVPEDGFPFKTTIELKNGRLEFT